MEEAHESDIGKRYSEFVQKLNKDYGHEKEIINELGWAKTYAVMGNTADNDIVAKEYEVQMDKCIKKANKIYNETYGKDIPEYVIDDIKSIYIEETPVDDEFEAVEKI